MTSLFRVPFQDSADYIVSGDKDLFDLKQCKSIKIIKASDFLKIYNDF